MQTPQTSNFVKSHIIHTHPHPQGKAFDALYNCIQFDLLRDMKSYKHIFIIIHLRQNISSSKFYDRRTESERILFKEGGGNDIIPNRRYDEFYTK